MAAVVNLRARSLPDMFRVGLLLIFLPNAWTQGDGGLSQGQVNIINALGPQPTGPGFNSIGQSPRVTVHNLDDIDWRTVDRRAEEGWTHLYGFGERFYDQDIAGRPWNDQQIDLDFFLPFYGFRFNYTFIFPEGFVAFSYPHYIQPPYTFPNPKWPEEADPSLIAGFMTEQTFMSVGEHRISHVWYRVVSRPPNLIGKKAPTGDSSRGNIPIFESPGFGQTQSGLPQYRYYHGQLLRTQEGRIEDPEFLNQISEDIRRGMIGMRGFTAHYALVVTWERMAYGGSPKTTRLNLYDHVRRWQNTYQMVLATDEIRTISMFNYANINWTSSTQAGALFGRGGKQSAIVGFNGGNGTGFKQLPYSAEGNSYKLVQFGNTPTAGRWQTRIDESIKFGGCLNTTSGKLLCHSTSIPMLGGFSVNVTGPCFRSSNVIKMQIDEIQVDCRRIDMVVAQCYIPVNGMFRTGLTEAKISIDGGKTFPWWGKVYLVLPSISYKLKLLDDPLNSVNNWRDPMAENLTVKWSAKNITVNRNSLVDVTLWGYWEDVEGHTLVEIGSIGKNLPNTGRHTFNPRTLNRGDMLRESWKRFGGGMVQVRLSDDWVADNGDGLYWSTQIPFGWYYRPVWEKEYGRDWALEKCLDWFDYDGKRTNFIMELEPTLSCPCTLDQAVGDFGRFAPLGDCDAWGNSYCYYTQGASHCVISTATVWTGSGQMCCYDSEGWLMFSDDYEYNDQYLRWYSAGVPYRAHPWGSFPYKRPPYVPTMSNFYNDLMPYEYCCKWTPHCEFYFWRRQSSGCQEYTPPKLGFAYGEPHFITYDGQRYTFNGKGYYVLTMMKSPRHNLMVQVRMEQPPKTLWDTNVPATVITGLAAKDNGSSTVQVFARKDFRRWRYKLDVYVDGSRRMQDAGSKKLERFSGGHYTSPPRNYDSSQLQIRFDTGVGIEVTEKRGLLNIIVALPPNYNETHKNPYGMFTAPSTGQNKCSDYHRTMGLLGTWNNDKTDDLLAPDCNPVQASYPASESEARNIYYQFGEKWRADGVKYKGRSEVISCGPLVKNNGVIKYPIGNNYLDGVTVTFSCKPEYFLHGDKQRTCVNGSWTPGWWVWCRERPLETGLKWMTGILSAVGFVLFFIVIFCCCYKRRVKLQKQMGTYHRRNHRQAPKMVRDSIPPLEAAPEPQIFPSSHRVEPEFSVPVLEQELGKRGRFETTA